MRLPGLNVQLLSDETCAMTGPFSALLLVFRSVGQSRLPLWRNPVKRRSRRSMYIQAAEVGLITMVVTKPLSARTMLEDVLLDGRFSGETSSALSTCKELL